MVIISYYYANGIINFQACKALSLSNKYLKRRVVARFVELNKDEYDSIIKYSISVLRSDTN